MVHRDSCCHFDDARLTTGAEDAVPLDRFRDSEQCLQLPAAAQTWGAGLAPAAVDMLRAHGATSAAQHAEQVPQHGAPAQERNGQRLLGVCGAAMHEVEEALRELLLCSHTDMLLIKHSTQRMISLTPV